MQLPLTAIVYNSFDITKWADKEIKTKLEINCRISQGSQQVMLNSGEYQSVDAIMHTDNTVPLKAGYGIEFDDIIYIITDIRQTIDIDNGTVVMQYCLLTEQNLNA